MVKGGLPGQTGATFHFCLLLPISGAGKGLTILLPTIGGRLVDHSVPPPEAD